MAIVAATPLWPLHQKRRIKRIVMSTYQAASGAGAAAMEELSESTRAYLEGRAFQPKVLPHPYAFNVFTHNTKVDPETGYNEEETKVMQEARKIFGVPDLRVTATCVRVPVSTCTLHRVEHRARSAAVAGRSARYPCRTRRACAWSTTWRSNYFPMPRGRERQGRSAGGPHPQAMSAIPRAARSSLFVAGDQLRKGAALNAVQIAERLLGLRRVRWGDGQFLARHAVMKHEVSKSDREFRAAFEAGAYAPADFSHRAHVRLAYVYLADQRRGARHHAACAPPSSNFLRHHGIPADEVPRDAHARVDPRGVPLHAPHAAKRRRLTTSSTAPRCCSTAASC